MKAEDIPDLVIEEFSASDFFIERDHHGFYYIVGNDGLRYAKTSKKYVAKILLRALKKEAKRQKGW